MAEVPPFVQTDDKAFIRDTHNFALLNTDRAALARHRAAVIKSTTLARRVESLEAELADLRHYVYAHRI
jgi:hypothetical protein